ncbi:MAG: malate dehydrogenase [Candidatus Aenigmarchaeota archaeon]|nr:malate dehydrogenase [Candidatus Aenigmarchaeota archaeon]
MRKKITIVGAGKVGSTVAQILAYKGLGDIVIVNRTAGKAQGIAMDLMQSSPVVEGFDAAVMGAGDYAETKESDVAIITAGLPRKEGMSRDQLLAANAGAVRDIAAQLARHSPGAAMVVVTNPLDVMVHVAWKASGFKASKVIGMAGVLDTARFRHFIAKELGVSPRLVSGMVLGGHGDLMLPLVDYAKVKGKPLTGLMPKEKIGRIVRRTVNAGAEIISLEGDSAYYAPASSVVQMVESILLDKKMILPCSAYLNGQYGIKGVFLGVPVRLGKNGVEKIIELKLTKEELTRLQDSARSVTEMVKKAGI